MSMQQSEVPVGTDYTPPPVVEQSEVASAAIAALQGSEDQASTSTTKVAETTAPDTAETEGSWDAEPVEGQPVPYGLYKKVQAEAVRRKEEARQVTALAEAGWHNDDVNAVMELLAKNPYDPGVFVHLAEQLGWTPGAQPNAPGAPAQEQPEAPAAPAAPEDIQAIVQRQVAEALAAERQAVEFKEIDQKLVELGVELHSPEHLHVAQIMASMSLGPEDAYAELAKIATRAQERLIANKRETAQNLPTIVSGGAPSAASATPLSPEEVREMAVRAARGEL